jgi:hypothetical protein
MAAITVIEALDAEGGDTRQRLTARLDAGFVAMSTAEGDDSAAPLRVVRGGELVGLPIALFPGLVDPDPVELPSGEGLEDELLEEDDPGAGQPED